MGDARRRGSYGSSYISARSSPRTSIAGDDERDGVGDPQDDQQDLVDEHTDVLHWRTLAQVCTSVLDQYQGETCRYEACRHAAI